MEQGILHYSVLAGEAVENLAPVLESEGEGALLIDCTLGEGGHSSLFLKTFPTLSVIGLDRDREIISKAGKRLEGYGDRFTAINTWFDDFFGEDPEKRDLVLHGRQPDAILFDFGISIFHYEASGRGFSFNKDEPLDMRLNTDGLLTAEIIVNTYEEVRLADLIYQYGEERYSRRIASAICRRRREKAIKQSSDLADIIRGSVPREYRHGRIHPATRTFQALRIEVNGELDRIERAVSGAFNILRQGGRMAVISFHSLEDRIVKHMFREWAKKCICPPEAPRCICGGKARAKLITRKPIRPGEKEIRENAASRSAKLRCIEKLTEELPGKLQQQERT